MPESAGDSVQADPKPLAAWLVVARSPDRATGPDRRSPSAPSARVFGETCGRRKWHGRETVPQQCILSPGQDAKPQAAGPSPCPHEERHRPGVGVADAAERVELEALDQPQRLPRLVGVVAEVD